MEIPEIDFKLFIFDCLDMKFFCMLDSRQQEPMKNFFKLLETTQHTWESARKIAIEELHKIEFPNWKDLPDKLKDRLSKNSRSELSLQQMENYPKVQDFITMLNRNRKLDELL